MSSPSSSNSNLSREVMPPAFRSIRKSESRQNLRITANDCLRQISARSSEATIPKHRDSQSKFATREHTIFVYDWDDTLFPTYWVRHDKHLHWRHKLENQTNKFSAKQLAGFRKDLIALENVVIKVLSDSLALGHVVVVTLARPPWVELSCKNFFPKVGAFLEEHKIKVVYAQDLDGTVPETYDKVRFESSQEAELYWMQKKQRAIMGEVAKFYSESGASWKNVISVGDSDFERFATQASLRDYATLDAADDSDNSPEVGSAAHKLALLSPSTSRSKKPDNHAVSGWVGRHYRRLRCKTIKMFDSPSLEDLTNEMNLICRWLPALVRRDAGLDVDLEDEGQLEDVYHQLSLQQ